MAKRLGKSIDGIRYHIDKLKEEQIIERVGGDKGGYWKINDWMYWRSGEGIWW